jgi:hypothetical protein
MEGKRKRSPIHGCVMMGHVLQPIPQGTTKERLGLETHKFHFGQQVIYDRLQLFQILKKTSRFRVWVGGFRVLLILDT